MAKTGCIFLEGTPDPLYPELLVASNTYSQVLAKLKVALTTIKETLISYAGTICGQRAEAILCPSPCKITTHREMLAHYAIFAESSQRC